MARSAENFENPFHSWRDFNTPLICGLIFRAPSIQLFSFCIPLPFMKLWKRYPCRPHTPVASNTWVPPPPGAEAEPLSLGFWNYKAEAEAKALESNASASAALYPCLPLVCHVLQTWLGFVVYGTHPPTGLAPASFTVVIITPVAGPYGQCCVILVFGHVPHNFSFLLTLCNQTSFNR